MRPLGVVVLGAVLLCTWTDAAIASAEGPASSQGSGIESAGELFDLFGLDETAFGRFDDGVPFDDTEQALLAGVLMRLPQVKLVDLNRWVQRDIPWNDVAQRPTEYRREFLRIEGHVRRVTKIDPPEAVQQRYALESYYRCDILAEPGQHTVTVFARVIPKAWSLDTPLNARTSVAALFLKIGPESAPGQRELYFAADRVAWHPDTSLGRLGMDYGLFDTIEQMRPITNQERECFYQMLAAAGRVPDQEFPHTAENPASQLGPLMREPQAHVGKAYTFRGVARRVVKIHISDADTAARLGFDHYYEVVVFLDLDGVLEVAGKKVGSYPVVFCVRELPPEMPTGDEIGEVVRASGFMFKKWPYTTEMSDEQSTGLRMTSPLLIGPTVQWEQREQAASSLGPLAAGMFVALIVGILCIVWSFRRGDRRARQALIARRNSRQDFPSPGD